MEFEEGKGGYSTGAEMALEMFQAGERATAIFTGKRLAVSGTLLLDFCGLFVLHSIFWDGGCGDRVGDFCGIWGEEEGKEFEVLQGEELSGEKKRNCGVFGFSLGFWGLFGTRDTGDRLFRWDLTPPVRGDSQ